MRTTTRHIVGLLIFFSCSHSAFSQSIYAGGSGDGFSVSSVAQPDNPLFNIYGGGTSDGFSVASVAQPDNVLFDIYKGGVDDGFAFGSVAQPDNVLFDIYKGGNDDGFAFSSVAQPDNVLFDIYKGGTDDGFAFNSFAQADNVLFDIYKGGVADGFAFGRLGSAGGEIPLPIELLSFEGKYLNTLVYIQWKTASERNNDYFELERSKNSIDFTPLYKVQGAGTTAYTQTYSFTDENPHHGLNYYRLRQVDFDKSLTYSDVISVDAGSNTEHALQVIPNPSDNGSSVMLWLKDAAEGTPAQVVVNNVIGQVVTTFETKIDKDGHIKLSRSLTAELAGGIYVVTVRVNGDQFTARWAVK